MVCDFSNFSFFPVKDRVSLFFGSNEDMMLYAERSLFCYNSNVFSYFEGDFIDIAFDVSAKDMFLESKIIIVKDVSDKYCDIYLNLIEKFGDDTIFIFFSTKLRAKSILVNEFTTKFVVIKCYEIAKYALSKMIKRECDLQKVPLGKEIIDAISQNVSIIQISQEVRKLGLLSNKAINIDDISMSRSDNNFMHLYEISSGNTRKFNKINDISSIRILQNHFFDLYKGRLMYDMNVRSDFILKDIGIFFKNHEQFLSQIARYSLPVLGFALNTLIEAEIKIKNGGDISNLHFAIIIIGKFLSDKNIF